MKQTFPFLRFILLKYEIWNNNKLCLVVYLSISGIWSSFSWQHVSPLVCSCPYIHGCMGHCMTKVCSKLPFAYMHFNFLSKKSAAGCYMHTYVHIHACTHSFYFPSNKSAAGRHMHTYMHAYMHARIHFTFLPFSLQQVSICIHAFIHTYMHAFLLFITKVCSMGHTVMRTCMYTCIHTFLLFVQ
jgi:hypothetical protein